MPRRPHPGGPRGAALILVVIVIAVATLLVVGAIAFTGTERSAAVNQTRLDATATCRQAARNAVLSKISMGGVPVTEVILDRAPLGDGLTVTTKHLDPPGSTHSPAVATGRALPRNATGAGGADDMTNRYEMPSAFQSTPYQLTVVCTEPDGREHEFEFAFRIGL